MTGLGRTRRRDTTQNMITQQLIGDWLHETPFKPSAVVMSDGSRYTIAHPEAAIVSRNVIMIGTDMESDRFARCSILHVTDLVDAAPKS